MTVLRLIFLPLVIVFLVIGCAGEPGIEAVRILEAEESLDMDDLWPGFDPLEIPVAIYDGQNTVLARHPAPPEGFAPMGHHADLQIYEGRYPAVTANTSGEIGGVSCAMIMMDLEDVHDAQVTQDKSYDEWASVLVHESFHVFQHYHHPDWGANEAVAFTYPVEDTVGLTLRRMAGAALREAVMAEDDGVAASWTAGALAYRADRYGRMSEEEVKYDRGIELMEGTAYYVESCCLRERGGELRMEAAFSANEFRKRCYCTGRACCVLLDRFSPGWKDRLEGGEIVSLDSLLAEALVLRRVVPQQFPKIRYEEEFQRATQEVSGILVERARQRDEFFGADGWRLVIDVGNQSNVFWSAGFDPMNMVRLQEREVLHKRWVKLSGATGVVEVMNRQALTVGVGPHPMFDGVKRVVLTGLEDEPIFVVKGENAIIEMEGLTAKFSSVAVSRDEHAVTVRI